MQQSMLFLLALLGVCVCVARADDAETCGAEGCADGQGSLSAAYDLQTPEDSRKLYRDWATTYDSGFRQSRGYIYAKSIAELFLELADSFPATGSAPLLDVGAGTGAVAEHLVGDVDGLDISAEMLEVAKSKGLYRKTLVADLTQPLPLESSQYGGFVSAGTFTHGHVGPSALPELLRIARPGALFVLGINAQVFDDARFGSSFAALVADRQISAVDFRRVRIYSEEATHEHVEDQALVAVFTRYGQ